MLKFSVLCILGHVIVVSSYYLAPRLDGRIVGGSAASIENYPYQLSLQYYGSHVCGGAIISENYLLTTALCVSNGSITAYTVRAGSTSRGSGGTVYSISRMVRPSWFNSNFPYASNIVVVQIVGTFALGNSQAIVNLPVQDEDVAAGTAAVVTGWGVLTEGGSWPIVLQQVQIPIVDQASCNAAYGGDIYPGEICAGIPEGGKDACQGDGGGPLVAEGKLVGLVSRGYGCARPNYPGIYTRVAKFRDWISANSGV